MKNGHSCYMRPRYRNSSLQSFKEIKIKNLVIKIPTEHAFLMKLNDRIARTHQTIINVRTLVFDKVSDLEMWLKEDDNIK